jgi:RecA-family ATPase
MGAKRHVRPASPFVTRPVPWLWPLRLGEGKRALLQGGPGLGKSLIALDLCARLSTGRPFPDGQPPPDGPGDALIINAEDSVEDTIRPRLHALGADLDRVFLWDRSADLLRLPTHLSDPDAVLEEVRPRLVVLGPITAFLPGGCSSELSVRRALDPLGWPTATTASSSWCCT